MGREIGTEEAERLAGAHHEGLDSHWGGGVEILF